MKRVFFAAFAALMVSLMSAPCANAREKVFETRNFNPGEFEYVECDIPCDLIYAEGKCGVEIYARTEAFEKITCFLEGDKLVIKSKIRRFSDVDDIKIYVYSPVLSGVDLNGAIEMKAENGLKGTYFYANLNGAGELDIKGFEYKEANIALNGASEMEIEGMNCGTIKLTCNGTSDCELEGYAQVADLKINGVGKIDVKKLKADKVYSAVNGIGKIVR